MDFAETKLSRLFSKQILDEIENAHANSNFKLKKFKFEDDAYFLKRVNGNAFVFGYYRYVMWTDSNYLQPICLIKSNNEVMLLPEFENSYNKNKFPSKLSIFKFSGTDRLIITLSSLDIFHELKMNTKNFKAGNNVTFETITGLKFTASNPFGNSLFIHVDEEYIGSYNFPITKVEFDQKFAEKEDRLLKANLMGIYNKIYV